MKMGNNSKLGEVEKKANKNGTKKSVNLKIIILIVIIIIIRPLKRERPITRTTEVVIKVIIIIEITLS